MGLGKLIFRRISGESSREAPSRSPETRDAAWMVYIYNARSQETKTEIK